MSDPIDYRILEDIATALELIRKDNGYKRDVEAVALRPSELFEAPYDRICVYGWDIAKSVNVAQAVIRPTLTVILHCEIEDANNIQRGISEIAADVEKAVLVDQFRDQLATKTDVVRVFDKYVIDEGETEGGCFVELAVQFQSKWGDPYAVS